MATRGEGVTGKKARGERKSSALLLLRPKNEKREKGNSTLSFFFLRGKRKGGRTSTRLAYPKSKRGSPALHPSHLVIAGEKKKTTTY